MFLHDVKVFEFPLLTQLDRLRKKRFICEASRVILAQIIKRGTSYKCILLFLIKKKALLRLNLPKYSILQFFKYVKVLCALIQNEYQRLVPNSPGFIHIHPNSKLRITKMKYTRKHLALEYIYFIHMHRSFGYKIIIIYNFLFYT